MDLNRLKLLSTQLIIMILMLSSGYVVYATESTFITIDNLKESAPDSSSNIQWQLEPTKVGLKSTIQTTFNMQAKVSGMTGPVGWEHQITINGIMVLQEIHPKTSKSIEQIIPLASISDGTHLIELKVRDLEGNNYALAKKITLTATPIIKINPERVKKDIFDPKITSSFFGERDGISGIIEFSIDNRPIKTIGVTPKQNSISYRLSELTGQQIYYADLPPGNHLFTIKATGLNGSSLSQSEAIAGSSALSKVLFNHKADNRFSNLEITFPASSNPIMGSAEIHFDNSTIFTTQAKKQHLKITRDEILKALEKHNHKIKDAPVTMILSTRTANQMENWQEFSF